MDKKKELSKELLAKFIVRYMQDRDLKGIPIISKIDEENNSAKVIVMEN